MVRRIKVFAVFLFASCFFCFPARADWSSSDSSTLNDIALDVGISSGYTQSMYNWMVSQTSGLASYLTSISRSLNPDWNNSFADQLLNYQASIISAINSLSGKSTIPLYTEFENSESYMTGWNYGFRTNNGYIIPNWQTDGGWVQPYINNQYNWCLLSAGTYVVTVDTDVSWRLDGMDWVNGQHTLIYEVANISYIKFQFSYNPAWFGLKIRLATDVDIQKFANSSIGSSIDSHGSDLTNNVNQLDSLEDQVFQGLDTSLDGLDFSGSALAQVVAGFTFIRAVFSAVYSSSPYISVLINLSCMLGVLALFLRVQPRFSRWERSRHD